MAVLNYIASVSECVGMCVCVCARVGTCTKVNIYKNKNPFFKTEDCHLKENKKQDCIYVVHKQTFTIMSRSNC